MALISVIRVFFILLFLNMQNLFAVEIGLESIHNQSYFIQVGSFKRASNIQKVKDKLFEYELYLEAYKDFHRICVVNVSKKQKKDILREIRKIYPKAFISKRLTKKIAKSEKMKKVFTKSDKLSKQSLDLLNNIEPNLQNLDSNTILKTRKSFL